MRYPKQPCSALLLLGTLGPQMTQASIDLDLKNEGMLKTVQYRSRPQSDL